MIEEMMLSVEVLGTVPMLLMAFLLSFVLDGNDARRSQGTAYVG
jgi:hypothetical protein